jgi:hypothetical protein
MKTRISLAALFASIALLAGGCASSTTSGGTSPVATDTSGCPTTLAFPAPDSSKTICIAIGGTVTVDLSAAGGPWEPIDVTGPSLQTSGTPSAPPRGTQTATFTAKSMGTATIKSTHPVCPSKAGTLSCHAIAVWMVTIQVK